MEPMKPVRDLAGSVMPFPLQDPGDKPLEVLDGVTLSPDPAVARIQRRIAGAAQKFLDLEAKRPPAEQLTFSCIDCLGVGWVYVPCSGRSSDWRSRCTECAIRHDHLVLRACLCGELGIAHEAGIWFRRLCRKDRRGKAVVDESKLPAFERAMERKRFHAAQIKAALDRMIAGDSGRGEEEQP